MNNITWKFSGSVANKPKPRLVLTTREETLAFLSGEQPQGLDKYNVCSLYVCDFLDEMEKEGYVYNAPALRRFEEAHGLPAGPENGSPLSVLIYNCQGYRRARKMELDGWECGSPELIAIAFQTGSKIEIQGDGALGGTVRERFITRKMPDGAIHVFRPKKRKPLAIGGMPCRLVAA